MSKKYFIPPEFKMYFEPVPKVHNIVEPEALVLPESVKQSSEKLGEMGYRTYVMSDPKAVQFFDPAVIATINTWQECAPRPAYVIEIYEDLKKPADPWMRPKPYSFFDEEEGRTVFEVHVPRHEADLNGPNEPGSLLASWLHEIGHAIAYIFHLPAARQDPRVNLSFSEAPVKERVLNAEREAWDLGEALLRFTHHRRDCEKTYEDRPKYFRLVDERTKQ